MSRKHMNIEEFRNFLLEMVEQLEDKSISVEEASAIGKLGNSIISSVLDYAKAKSTVPDINFMEIKKEI